MADNIFELIDSGQMPSRPNTRAHIDRIRRVAPAPPPDDNIFAKIDAGVNSPEPKGPDQTGGFVWKAPPPATLWERLKQNVTDMFSPEGGGVNSAILRTNQNEREAELIRSDAQRRGLSPEQADALVAQNLQSTANITQDVREQRALRDAGDPIIRPGDHWYSPGSIARGGATFLGQTIGDINPTYAIAPGQTWLTRMLAQGGVNAATDAAVQGQEISTGVQEEFDPVRTAVNFGMGAGFQGTFEGAGALRNWWKGRGVDTSAFDDETLVSGTLDGTIGDSGLTPEQVDAMLKGGGAQGMEQFSTPEVAATAAQRVQAAQGRAPVNMGEPGFKPKNVFEEIDRRAQIEAGIASGEIDPSFAPEIPSRVMPGDVPIIGAPEGNVRADDAGALQGLERKRAADSNVLSRAQQAAAEDPVVGEVLNSNLSPQAKLATVWDRVSKINERTRASLDEPVDAQAPQVDIAEPWKRATPEAAAREGGSFDRMIGVESGGRQFGQDGKPLRSPKGAVGRAQVMPATGPEAARDAGLKWDPVKFENDPAYNEALGRAYHDKLLRKYGGDETKAAAAYNAGPGRVDYALHRASIDKQGRDWTAFVPKETRDYIRKTGAAAPEAGPSVYRGDSPDNLDQSWAGNPSAAERMDAQASPTNRQREAGQVFEMGPGIFRERGSAGSRYESPMQSGTPEGQPFKQSTDPNANHWEDEARRMHEEFVARKKAQEEEFRQSSNREQQQREGGAAGADPSGQYRGSYGQKPHLDGEFWRTTKEGYVADKDGKPVAFRNPVEAAKWAAKNKMGGDFELAVWGTNSSRVVLRKKPGSTYGERPAPPPGPAEPAAGRSADTSTRAINGPESVKGENGPSDTPEARNEPPEQAGGDFGGNETAPPSREPVSGRDEEVVANGGKVQTQFKVMEARDLIASNDKGYDASLQPRDRAGRATSDEQIARNARELDPEQLASSRLASTGAPIVGPNRMVESGNGRVSFIRRAYELHPEKAAEYRAMIERQGLDVSGFDQPVLVRERKSAMSPEELRKFTVDAQDSGVMKMSATEQAAADAKAITPDMLKLYKGGDVGAAGNRDFQKAYLEKAVSADHLNDMVKADGSLSADGANRLRSAMTHRAFKDEKFVEKLTQDEDTDIKAIGNVLIDSSPAIAALQDRIAAGELPKAFDIAPQLKEAARLISKSREEKIPLNDLLNQSDIFSGDMDPMTKAVARMMMKGDGLDAPRSAKALRKALDTYLSDAGTATKDMLGGDMKERAVSIANAAADAVERESAKSGDMFGKRALEGKLTKADVEHRVEKLKDSLGDIAASDPNRRRRELAAKLQDLVGDDMTIAYGKDAMEGSSAVGWADITDGNAAVRRYGDSETVLHEAIHLVAMTRYGAEFDRLRSRDAATPHFRELDRTYQEALRRFERRPDAKLAALFSNKAFAVKYGLSNIDEFLAVALTNPGMQKFLERGSLWDRLVEGVRGLIGLEPKFKPLLSDAIKAGSAILESTRADVRGVPKVTFGKRPEMAAGPDWKNLADKVADVEGLGRDFKGMREAVGNPTSALKKFTEPMGRIISAGVFTNDARLRGAAEKFKSDAMHEMADKWFARPGKGDATGRTYHEAVTRASTTRAQRAYDALEPFLDKPAAMERIRDMLSQPTKSIRATDAERAAAKQVRDLLKETIEYRKDAGESIGEVTDGYFPRVLDVEKVVKGRDTFLKAAERLYSGLGVSDPKVAAEQWFQRVFDSYAGLDGGLDHGSSQSGGGLGSSTAKAREFGKDADRLLRDFYNDDVFGTLSAYFTGSAKRAEFSRRFGKPGREGSPERLKWEKEHGDKTQLEELNQRIKADVVASGKDPAGFERVIDSVTRSNLGQMGSSDPFARTSVSYLHAWNQLSKMDHTLVTSLGELTMGFIRGGPRYGFSFVKDSMQEFARQIRKAPPSEAQRWAEAIGVCNDAVVTQGLSSRINNEGSTKGVQKMLAGYYKGIGLHQFTEGERIASTKMGRKFISTLAHDLQSSSPRVKSRAQLYLKELGIKDPEAFGSSLRKAEPELRDVLEDKGGIASEYGTALMRFVNQTVMMPSRAEKPTWAAHPVGSLVFSLMGYSYGFKKNVLDRGGRLAMQGFKDKDPALLIPAMSLSIMAGFQALNDTYLRPYLFGSGYDFSKETPTEMMLRVSDRAGFTGAASPFINAIKAVKYDRSMLESLSGPVIGSIFNAGQKIAVEPFTDRNSPNTNTAERNAAAAFYDAIIDPMIDGFAAGRLKGAVRSAAILGTGNKEGGVAPSDREAFVSEVAGEKLQ